MTKRKLELFAAYAQTNPLSVEAVAKRFFVSQEAIRAHFSQLQKVLGFKLTEKTPGSNKRRLTFDGQQFAKKL